MVSSLSAWNARTWAVGVEGRLELSSIRACERNDWTLLAWRAGGEGTAPIKALPYRCGSWRCRRCSWVVAREDYRRVEAAVKSRPWWLYAVLTFDPKAWEGSWEAYQGASALWDKRLRRRLEREYGRLAYLQTWERHRSGWPHVNLLLASQALQERVQSLPSDRPWIQTGNHGAGRLAHRTRWRRELARMAPECGFGPRVWVEVVDSQAAVSAYLVKIAEELSRATEKQGDQRPLGAPPHFRRIRASRGLLPARVRVVYTEREDDRTGEVRSWLREKPADAPSDFSGVLSPQPLSNFETREPGWGTDVADAWLFQARAWKKKREKGLTRYETGVES